MDYRGLNTESTPLQLASKLAASQPPGGAGYGGPQQGGYPAQQPQAGQKPGGYVSNAIPD